jgi:CheY-like chemotaxis protein
MHPRTKKVLIVEDDFTVVFMLQVCYEQLGFEVVANLDCAPTAIEYIRENPNIDLISMDITLVSKQTGLEAAVEIRNMGVNTPIIFASANIDLREKTMQIPFSTFCEKPMGFTAITRAVNEVLSL